MKTADQIKKMISKLPDEPGVYFFRHGKKILYIGKATSLRDRVRSYFNSGIELSRGPLIVKMLSEFDNVAYQKTDSVLEALVLEASLIKKHQPEANIKDKDNRSFNYVIITKEDFSRILTMRGRELEAARTDSAAVFTEGKSAKTARASAAEESVLAAEKNKTAIYKTFGPFTNGSQLREAMKIVRRLFPFRGKNCEPGQGRACFERQLGLCPGVCTGEISKEDYKKQIRNIALFFEGNKKKLTRSLEREMKEFAKKREFEKAERVKRQLYAIYHIQDISLIKRDPIKTIPRDGGMNDKDSRPFRIESYDIAHISGTNVVGVMTVVEDGEAKKSDYRKFNIKDNPGVNDTKALTEVLTRRLHHEEWPFPDLMVVDGGKAQKNAMERVLANYELDIPVAAVVKDERHRPRGIMGMERLKEGKIEDLEREILLSNAEAHRFATSFHRRKRGKLL